MEAATTGVEDEETAPNEVAAEAEGGKGVTKEVEDVVVAADGEAEMIQ